MAGLASIASFVSPKEAEPTNPFVLYQLDAGTDARNSDRCRRFQYFPESLSDNKAVNWTSKEVPGASLPLYQWVNSGERQISFTAIFTSDIDLTNIDAISLKNAGLQKRNVDVKSALLWLRSFMLPTYPQTTSAVGTPLTQAPRKAVLSIENSGIGAMGGDFSHPDEIVCIMNSCDITYDAFWPSGSPRIATVSLAFAQIAQVGGNITFPQYGQNMQDAVFSPVAGGTFKGYNLVVKNG
jgi:hypothetical protein